MPYIYVNVPRGMLDENEKTRLKKEITETVLRIEGAPDTQEAKSISFMIFNEIDEGGWSIGGKDTDAPRYIVNLSLPAGVLNDEGKNEMVTEIHKMFTTFPAFNHSSFNPMQAWVVINDVVDGNWGFAGKIFRLEDIAEFVGVDQ